MYSDPPTLLADEALNRLPLPDALARVDKLVLVLREVHLSLPNEDPAVEGRSNALIIVQHSQPLT